jgi:hypothetical protein
MPRYLIEINHEDDYEGCVKALDALLRLGSHLVSQAEFGCRAGVHSGWLIADVPTREDAVAIVPPQLRSASRVVELQRWTPDEIREMAAGLGTT